MAGGINLYAYAPNPLTWVDPWGWSCGSDAKILRENMIERGIITPNYKNSAHHIIMSNAKDVRMRWLRRKMNRLGIDINDAINGVYLPTSSKIKIDVGTSTIAHSKIHTALYKQNVFDRLKNIKDATEFRQELNKIAEEILNGTFSY